MSSVVIDLGHVDYSSGAVANGFREDNLNKSIGGYTVSELQRHNVNVTVTTGTLEHRVQVANSIDANLFVSIHNNAGGGDGTEVLHYPNSTNGIKLAQNIHDEIVAAGLNNSRGLKARDGLYVLKHTKMPSALIECAFMDTNDIQAVDTEEERKAFGMAIAKGILKALGVSYKSPEQPIPPLEQDKEKELFWRVVVDSYRSKEYAEARVNELKNRYGISSFIVPFEK